VSRLLDLQFRETDDEATHFRKLRALVEEIARLSKQKGATTTEVVDGGDGGNYVIENVGTGVALSDGTNQVPDPRVHRIFTLNAGDNITVTQTESGVVISGSAAIDFATNAETDAGSISNKAVQPAGGAYAYDRLRHVGQHAAGKGTATVVLTPDTGVVTVNGALSNVFYLTLAEDLEMANPVNPINGQTVNIHLKQDETGGHQITEWGSQWKFTNRINPTLSTDGNSIDLLSCQWNETDAIMECSFLPNFGSDYTPPPTPGFEDFDFINVGGGNELYRDTVGTNINIRTVVGEGDVSVTTVDDTVVVSYTTPVIESVQYFNDLLDVNSVAPVVGDVPTFDGEYWVPARGRRWTLGATWTNGVNAVALPVNRVSSVISERCEILGWYLLTDGGNSSCVVDVRRVAVAEFPPLSSDSICGSEKPSITAAFMAESFDMEDWDPICEEGDLIQFVLESTSVFTTVQIVLILEKRA
jgi:hypothetical protein